MFKCKECEKIFDIKPNYCDCGNDVFIEIIEKEPETIKKAPKKSFEEQYPWFSNFKHSLDPLSVIIFCICIVLSILSLIFIGRGDNTVEEKTPETIAIKKINTDIESFWDNSLPRKEEVKTVVAETQKPEPIKVVSTQTKPKAQSEPKKTVQKPQVQKPVQTKPQTTKTTKQTTQQKPQQTQTKPQTAQTPQTKPQTTQNTIQTPKINIEPEVKVQKPTQAELQELKNYKNALRNLIFSYIDFTSIIGDGVCTITFTINESGRLVNRQFSQESASVMLNDAVYAAVKKVPSFKQPPSAYKGETLKFTVQFVSGQYEVSLN